jgi:hypothetical protein
MYSFAPGQNASLEAQPNVACLVLTQALVRVFLQVAKAVDITWNQLETRCAPSQGNFSSCMWCLNPNHRT